MNHPVFHASELLPYFHSTIEGYHQPPTPVIKVEEEANYVAQNIGKSKENKRRKRVEYLLFWEVYPPKEATWKPAENLVDTAEEALREFHKRYPKQSRNPRVKP